MWPSSVAEGGSHQLGAGGQKRHDVRTDLLKKKNNNLEAISFLEMNTNV